MDLFHPLAFAKRIGTPMQEHHVPGLAIAVTQGDQTPSLAFGKACLDPDVPFTTDTFFDMASCSKSLTAASVALLVEDEDGYPDVQYDTPVSKLLPEDFVLPKQSYTEDVTLDDILSHRSGMSRHDLSYLGSQAAQPDTAESVTRSLRDLPLAAPVRSKHLYNNMMYTVAAHLVAKLSSKSFSDFLAENFFVSLDMSSTNLQPSLARRKCLDDKISHGHHWNEDTGSYDSWPAWDSPEAEGAGSIVTSVNDYIKYVREILKKHAPFTEGAVEGVTKPRIIADPDESPEDLGPWTSPRLYAAAWEAFYYHGHKVVAHGRSVQGFESDHFFLPEFDFGAVLPGNSGGASDVIEILKRELTDEAVAVMDGDRPDWSAHMKRQRNKWEAVDKTKPDEVREQLSASVQGLQLQEALPLKAYVGTYHNAGYHSFDVQEKGGKLFIDASDRSFPCTLTFEHVAGNTMFIAHISDNLEGGDEPIKAEFKIADGRVVEMGLDLEEVVGELMWFKRV